MPTVQHSQDGWNKLNLAIKELESKVSKAGWFESNKYEDGTPVAYVASIQEFGCPERSIPPRPFMRPTVAEKKSEWASIAELGSKAILKGDVTAEVVMGQLADSAVGDVKKMISSIQTPALSPITIELRAMKKQGEKITGATVGIAAAKVASEGYTKPQGISTKPLIDDGIMFDTMMSKVEDKS